LASALALAVYAVLLAGAAVAVWRRPVLALYAFLITALTARYTNLLPPGTWLTIHRVALVVFVLAWLHGILAGTDSDVLRAMYVGAGLAVLSASSYRYWTARRGRPTFATSRTEVTEP